MYKAQGILLATKVLSGGRYGRRLLEGLLCATSTLLFSYRVHWV